VTAQIEKDIKNTAYLASYDECCKKLLAHKIILAHIMKECVEEFKDFNVNYIAENYIEGNPEISKINVHCDEKIPNKIVGMNNEDTTINEGTVFYDIRFFAVLPKINETVKLIINIEAQKNYYPGYSLVKRGIYYACRLISSQYQTEFTESEYSKIKKVYSIWICTNPPKERQNTITRYRITEDNVIGSIKEELKNYDLINVIMICLNEDSENINNKYSGILKLLRVYLSDFVDPLKKKEILTNEFDISMSDNIERELNNMCNLSSNILERGIELGKRQGIEQGKGQGIELGKKQGIELGKKQGKREEKIEIAKALLDVLDVPTISKKTGLTVEEIEKLK